MGWLDWAIVLLATALGFAAIAVLPAVPGVPASVQGPVTAAIFGLLPLAALAWRAGPHWRALFNGWRWSYLGWGVTFGLLNLVFTVVIGMLAVHTLDLNANAMIRNIVSDPTPAWLVPIYATTAIQLFGEEMITIVPFLFVLWVAVNRLGLSRMTGVIMAWVGSALLFAVIHLPTYGWNLMQVFLLIGPVRLVLTLAYMKTKSIWASTIAHVLNDWTMFTTSIAITAFNTAP